MGSLRIITICLWIFCLERLVKSKGLRKGASPCCAGSLTGAVPRDSSRCWERGRTHNQVPLLDIKVEFASQGLRKLLSYTWMTLGRSWWIVQRELSGRGLYDSALTGHLNYMLHMRMLRNQEIQGVFVCIIYFTLRIYPFLFPFNPSHIPLPALFQIYGLLKLLLHTYVHMYLKILPARSVRCYLYECFQDWPLCVG